MLLPYSHIRLSSCSALEDMQCHFSNLLQEHAREIVWLAHESLQECYR